MADEFQGHGKGLTSPATQHFQIAPGDSVLDPLPRVIFCQGAGDIVIEDENGNALTYTMAQGDRLDFRAVKVLAAGTTGTFCGWS